jgi:hypothetical protein
VSSSPVPRAAVVERSTLINPVTDDPGDSILARPQSWALLERRCMSTLDCMSTEATESSTLSRLLRRTDVVLAVLAAVATVGFAWCGYQSSSWVRERFERADTASDLGADAIGVESEADRIEQVDVLLYAQWVAAIEDGDTELAESLFGLFRPEVRALVGTVDQPPSTDPFGAEDYSARTRRGEARELEQRARALTRDAADASAAAARYSGIAVTFTAVLAATGIAIRFQNARVRRTFVVITSVLSLVAIVLVALSPIRFG